MSDNHYNFWNKPCVFQLYHSILYTVIPARTPSLFSYILRAEGPAIPEG